MRLTSGVWVSAYLTRLRLADVPAFVVRRGDDTAGAVLVKLNTLDGQATLFQRSFDLMTGERQWMTLASGDDRDMETSVAKQVSFDSDLWVIEVESKDGTHLLDDPSLA